jgi:hypothetical protein
MRLEKTQYEKVHDFRSSSDIGTFGSYKQEEGTGLHLEQKKNV